MSRRYLATNKFKSYRYSWYRGRCDRSDAIGIGGYRNRKYSICKQA